MVYNTFIWFDGIIFFMSILLMFIYLFPKTASKIPTIKKFLEYLHLKPKYWHSLNFTDECFICKESSKNLGTMCTDEQHRLCYQCSCKWIDSQIEDKVEITCPYCRQNV